MIVWYARVSTIDQNPQLQIDALKDAGCDKIFVEHVSAVSKNRPEFEATLNFLRPWDTIVVWKLSRMARSLAHIINIARDLQDREVNLKVITQNFETQTPEGRLFFHLMASFDEFQRELIKENTKAGIIAARKAWKTWWRKKVSEENLKLVETMLKDKVNYKNVSDVIRAAPISRTSFYTYFSPERIEDLRWAWQPLNLH